MSRPRYVTLRSLLTVGTLTTAAVVATPAVSPATGATTSSTAVTIETTAVTIPVRDGVTISGSVSKPTTGTNWPVVVMPGTFAGDSININIIASKLAARGFVTVSYLERGFGKSGGEIDAGGPKDVSDASDVLTWVLANSPSDPKRVGIAGISYGAGFAPIVAAKDPRFKAVAMVSGWGDMWESRYPNRTSAFAANVALWGLSKGVGRPSKEIDEFFSNSVNNVFTEKMHQQAIERSPRTYLPQLSKRNVPMYVSTSMNEAIWPADQTIDFFNAYPGTKHLDILPGDHATSELGTPAGLPGVTWLSAFDWMQAYVAGTGGPATGYPLVRVSPRSPNGTDILESNLFANFPFEAYGSTAVRATKRQYLATKSSLFGLMTSTSLSDTATGDSKKLREGENLLLQNGIPMYQGGFEVVFGTPTTVPIAAIDQGVTGLWTGPKLTAPLSLRGATKVHLDLTPSAAKGSVFVYLLEQAPGGTTYVVGHKPYSWSGATAGKATPIDVTIPYNAYDVPAGHKLIVGVSTGDVLYTDNNPAGSSVKVGPGSYVDLPLK